MLWDILNFFGPAGLPALTACATFAVFDFAERLSSREAKVALTKQLETLDVHKVVLLPQGAQNLFQHIFGTHHWSFRCFVSSVSVSIAAVCVLSLVYIAKDWQTFKPAFDFAWAFGLWKAYVIWIPVSAIPDYINLYKTRIVISFLGRRAMQIAVLPLILIIDLAAGLFIFIMLFNSLKIGLSLLFNPVTIPLTNDSGNSLLVTIGQQAFSWSNIFSLNGNSIAQLFGLGSIVSAYFLAGMMPSIWLWIFIIAILLTRFLLRTETILNWLRWFLKIKKAPFRSVGFVASVSVFIFVGVVTALFDFISAVT